MRYIILFLLCAVVSQAIEGVLHKHPNKQVVIFESFGKSYRPIDSVKTDTKGYFKINSGDYETGFYIISVDDTNYADVIISKEEPNAYFEFFSENLYQNFTVHNSIENIALNQYQYYQRNCGNSEELCSQAPRLVQLYFIDNHPKLFISSVYKASINWFAGQSVEEQRKVYFDSVDFSDRRLMRSTAFNNAVNEYLIQITEHTPEGFAKSVDLIMQKASADSEIKAFIIEHLINIFSYAGPESMVEYVKTKYIDTDPQNAGFSYLPLINTKAKDMEFPTTNIYKELGTNEYALIAFISAGCGSCQEEMGKLLELQESGFARGVSVVVIDKKCDAAKKSQFAINGNKYFNSCESDTEKYFDNYKIFKTPTFILIDKNKIIRMKSNQIESLLDSLK